MVKLSKSLILILCIAIYSGTLYGETHGKWKLEVTTDPMTDKRIATAYTSSIGTKSTWGNPQRLFVRCSGGDLDVYITWDQVISGNSGHLQLRFDDNEMWEVRYNISNDYFSTFLSDSDSIKQTFVDFIVSGRESSKLLARVTPFAANPRLAKFSMSGFSKTALKVADECGYASDYMSTESKQLFIEKQLSIKEQEDKDNKEQEDKVNRAQGIVSEYVAYIQEKVRRNWLQPPGSPHGLSCVVQVSLIAGGDVANVQVVVSSGDTVFDRSVEAAVFKAAPLPLPREPSMFSYFRDFVFVFKP